MAAHLQHAAGADAVGLGGAEAGVEEAGVVDAELAHRRVDRGHLGGLQHRDLHRLLGGQDVELAGIEQQLAAARLQRLPEVARVVAVLAVEVDRPRRGGGRGSRRARRLRSTPTLRTDSAGGSPRFRRSWFSRVPARTSTEKVCGAISR